MRRDEAEDYVYASYLRAQPFQDRAAPDSRKRHPELTEGIIRSIPCAPSVCVTGSKGKGSVCTMVSRMLSTEMRVGTLTSPHIRTFNERIRIDGRMISDDDLVRCAEQARSLTDPIEEALPDNVCISPMGIQAVMALLHFRDRTDFNVLECGKGARYDDIARVPHEYSVINTVFPEHTRELGPGTEDIARDKSFIIRRGQECAYTGRQDPDVLDILRARADAENVPLKAYGRDFRAEDVRFTGTGLLFDAAIGEEVFRDIALPFLGSYQAENCVLSMALCRDVLGHLDSETVNRALSGMRWPGRTEVVSEDPLVIIDACINRGSCRYVLEALDALGADDAVFVIGIPDDKDYMGVVSAVRERAGRIILSRSRNPHYVFSSVQWENLSAEGIATETIADSGEAIGEACRSGGPVVILGTTSFIAEAEERFRSPDDD